MSGLDPGLKDKINAASCGITDKTAKDYEHLMDVCEAYLLKNHLISKKGIFFSAEPLQDAPYLVVAWIMNLCDKIKLDGMIHAASETRATYGHAQKMRAAMTYAFGHIYQLGSVLWH
ncbi:hypothetical protein P691DRAFT_680830 [Macrolepiota fuliginosa MF-IS2]|uniref:Uncharacterized protein n=1 Tax=Macrolepiota fuliginosa MF-IS2 TaxID=1400762 RepID=A0A9P6BWD7_9AGAR|nr:hypothetical protein P691DRAFT_680830 [Macrolepiota fuliginosa MF-IS2]